MKRGGYLLDLLHDSISGASFLSFAVLPARSGVIAEQSIEVTEKGQGNFGLK
jgi:hypothetical protein